MPSQRPKLMTILCESRVAVLLCFSIKCFCLSKHPRAHILDLTCLYLTAHLRIHTQSTKFVFFGRFRLSASLNTLWSTKALISFLSAASTNSGYRAMSSSVNKAVESSVLKTCPVCK